MASSKKRPASAGCTWATCPKCGVEREIPAATAGRGPQRCNACGALVVKASPGFKPGKPPESDDRAER